MNYEKILQIPPYSLSKDKKNKLLTGQLTTLIQHHIDSCNAYKNILTATNFQLDSICCTKDIPFIPIQMFKDLELKSISEKQIFKTMMSSGTTGQKVSKIFLDRETSANQQKTLSKIVCDFIGKGRYPMLIIDSPSIIKNRQMFSARGAGILGFSIFGSEVAYALKENMTLDIVGIKNFLGKHTSSSILIFGFTFIIWQNFYHEIIKNNIDLNIVDAILIHGGGWKKLKDKSISTSEFNSRIKQVCGISRIHNYYGMVEQTGCIYIECEHGYLHTSIFSDVIIRRYKDFSVCDIAEKGIIQVLSMLPKSYPGHSILTEDEGVLLGIDDCLCGRLGKYFRVEGRLKQSEIRGCSDAFDA